MMVVKIHAVIVYLFLTDLYSQQSDGNITCNMVLVFKSTSWKSWNISFLLFQFSCFTFVSVMTKAKGKFYIFIKYPCVKYKNNSEKATC